MSSLCPGDIIPFMARRHATGCVNRLPSGAVYQVAQRCLTGNLFLVLLEFSWMVEMKFEVQSCLLSNFLVEGSVRWKVQYDGREHLIRYSRRDLIRWPLMAYDHLMYQKESNGLESLESDHLVYGV